MIKPGPRLSRAAAATNGLSRWQVSGAFLKTGRCGSGEPRSGAEDRISPLAEKSITGTMNNPSRTVLALALLCAASPVFQLHAEQTGPPRRVLAADDSTRRLAIVAPDGALEWEIKVGAIHDAWILPNGNILLQQGWTKIVEVTPDKKAVWEYDAGRMNGNEGKRVEVHAFQGLSTGRR